MTQQQQLTEQIAKLNQIIGEDGEQTLLEAISKQRWYGFKNKREIVFDTWTGLLFPNFEYMSYIPLSDWKNKQKNYEMIFYIYDMDSMLKLSHLLLQI